MSRRWVGVFRVWVPGHPVPQGSKNIGRAGRGPRCSSCGQPPGKPILVDTNAADLEPWRSVVANYAVQARQRRKRRGLWRGPIAEPCRVDLEFVLPRPKTAKAGALPDKQRTGDGDKLTRAVWDALTHAQVFTDDARVVSWSGDKRYAEVGEQPGVAVAVSVLPAPQPAQLDLAAAGEP